ncbi:hypothetical protein EZV62_003876 [Acer yangbiense]|uniref:C-JID domain-containing protein n=1 Tax=Acer yangbiense TaxID=1000413 RepID=A0A5C7III3_9ROSI|nr:hypothetical protein EZV62_003876 [Acer yangbiense]
MSKIRDIDLKPCAFANMHKLRYLNFYVSSFGDANKVHVSEDHEFDFTELRYLSWHGCPMKSLLSSFLPENLVKLDMSNSKIEQLWNGVQHCAKLKEINFGGSSITICPDLSGFPNLKRLYLYNCKYLHEISSSIQDLDKLDFLQLSLCSNLEILPEMPCNLESLLLGNSHKGDAMVCCYSAFNGHLYSEDILYADFGNCCKLDPNISEDIVKDAIRKSNTREKYSYAEDDKAAVVDAFICYPGSEIPEWFKFRSNESFINVELPPDWFDYNYAGFVLSVVVAPCLDHQDDEFYIRHDMKQQYKVEKCGVHLIFAQHREEVNGSSRIREDEDVLSLANVHDKCEEEDELIKELIKYFNV